MRPYSLPLATRRTLAATLLMATATLGTPALASDVTAVFETSAGNVTIEYRDDQYVRMRAADDAFFVVREGKGYMVNREGGQWQVIAVDDLAGMMGAARGAAGRSQPAERDAGEFRFTDTGRTESQAGIRGKVYEYAQRDSWTGEWSAGEEVVLSDDARARSAYRGLTRVTEILGAMAGAQGLDGRPDTPPELKDQAVLRYGNEWRLTHVDQARIPDRHFTLPAEPMAMPGGMQRGQGHGQGHAPAADAAQDNWAAEEARQLGREAADEARGETRRGVSENVREGVRGLFGR